MIRAHAQQRISKRKI